MFGRVTKVVLLDPSVERRVIRVRRHWAVLLEVLLQTVGIVLGAFLLSRLFSGVANGFWLQALLWYVAGGAVLRFAWKALRWWTGRIIVTDKQFIVARGVFKTKNSMMPITKVIDVSYSRPVAGQLLGYGTLMLELAGQKQRLEKIKYLPKPVELFLALSELIFSVKMQSRYQLLPPPRPRRN